MSLLQKMESGAEAIAAYFSLIAATLIFAGVILRNTISASPSWITEIPTYLFIWAVFLALSRAFSKGPQLGLDILGRRLPLAQQKILHVMGATAMLLIAATMAWLGVELFIRQWTTGAVSNTALRFPLCWVTFAMVLGFSLLMVHAAQRLTTLFSDDHRHQEALK